MFNLAEVMAIETVPDSPDTLKRSIYSSTDHTEIQILYWNPE